MGTNYEQLPDEERATIMVMTQAGQSLRAMARILHRVPSTISREWRRHAEAAELGGTSLYSAKQAGQEARRRRFQQRRVSKLAVEGVLFGVVHAFSARGLVAGPNCWHSQADVA
jgi:IS30 family transposase